MPHCLKWNMAVAPAIAPRMKANQICAIKLDLPARRPNCPIEIVRSWHDSPITSNLGLPWKRVRCAKSTWREAVLEGVKEAARLHEQLALRTQIEATPGSIDVFSVIVQLNIPPLFRLLGTFLPKP